MAGKPGEQNGLKEKGARARGGCKAGAGEGKIPLYHPAGVAITCPHRSALPRHYYYLAHYCQVIFDL